MADASVRAEVHKPLDVHGRLAAQVTFDRELRDDISELGDLGLQLPDDEFDRLEV